MSFIKDCFNKIRHNYYGIAKVLAFLVAIVLVCWQMPRAAKFKYEYQLSKPWPHETLYAPFDFPIYKDDATLRAETEAATNKVLPIFVFDDAQTQQALNTVMTSFESAWRENSHFDKDLSLDFLLQVYDSIENQGIVAYDKAVDGLDPVTEVSLVRNQVMRTVHYGDFYSMTTATEAIAALKKTSDSRVDRNLVCELLEGTLRQNVFYNADLTKQATDKALNTVSLTYGMVQKDEIIVSEGELVDEHTYNILDSLQREFNYRSMSREESLRILLTQLFLVALIFTLMGLYVSKLHKKIFSELRNVVFLLVLVLLVVIPLYWICKLNPSWILIMPVSILAIMISAFFNLRLAFAVQVFAVMLISLAVPNPFQFIFMQLVATILTTFTMSNTRVHHRFIQTAIFVLIGYLFVYLAFTFLSGAEIGWNGMVLLTLNAMLILLAQPIILMFERVFGFTTSLSLLELSNTNSPLLRQLATTAPGTFQHSIQVANLCEEVLYEIGGNSLLARTGALYHDVGKINNPMYFTENQHGAYSPHNDLSNLESAEIIISHVTDGIELAHKNHVPERIIDFIRTHHGTRRTEYFFINEQKAHPGEEIDPAPFTYHGPAPFSRETAVLMMCDSIEAASHSLKDPDEKKISDLVDNIINKQMDAGQFLNTDLTMRDIETCRKVLKKKLMSIYHVRIAYPEK
ncbi:MAG: HDIG domain-containing protein [Bacteroidales bacterium]|nr:HDIG domain-containing protein [Bacteroidales bacterium]